MTPNTHFEAPLASKILQIPQDLTRGASQGVCCTVQIVDSGQCEQTILEHLLANCGDSD